eukprot:1513637-Pyramimonas_sp.AAC.1
MQKSPRREFAVVAPRCCNVSGPSWVLWDASRRHTVGCPSEFLSKCTTGEVEGLEVAGTRLLAIRKNCAM